MQSHVLTGHYMEINLIILKCPFYPFYRQPFSTLPTFRNHWAFFHPRYVNGITQQGASRSCFLHVKLQFRFVLIHAWINILLFYDWTVFQFNIVLQFASATGCFCLSILNLNNTFQNICVEVSGGTYGFTLHLTFNSPFVLN